MKPVRVPTRGEPAEGEWIIAAGETVINPVIAVKEAER
jgi:hypothetical protein